MSSERIDPETAESLARDRLTEALRPPTESNRSDFARLADQLREIRRAVDRGETPDQQEIRDARVSLRRVEDRLDEVTALFGWHPWDTGTAWGDLTDAQRAAIERRERSAANETPTTDETATTDETTATDETTTTDETPVAVEATTASETPTTEDE